MGLLSRLFSTYNEHEEELIQHYTELFTGRVQGGADAAAKAARKLVDLSIEQAKEVGTYALPPNFGDLLVKIKPTDDPWILSLITAYEKYYPVLEKDGVTANDVRTWFNISSVERMAMLNFDHYMILKGLSDFAHAGLIASIAEKGILMTTPIFGPPEEDEKLKGDNKPLPVELKHRVGGYIVGRRKDHDQLLEDARKAGSVNALIRKEIRAGRL